MYKLLILIYRRIISSDFIGKIVETFASKIIGLILGIAMSIMISRALGPEGKGNMAITIAIAALGIQFCNLGLHAANTYYAAYDKKLAAALLGNSLLASMVLGGILVSVSLMVIGFKPELFPLQGLLLVMSLLYIPFGLCATWLQNLLIGINQIRFYNIVEISTRLFHTGLIALIIFCCRANAKNIFLTNIITIIVLDIMILGKLIIFDREGLLFSFTLFKKCLDYGFKIYLVCFFAWLVLQVDLLMINQILGSEQAGYYSISAAIAAMIVLLPTVIGTIMFPKIAALQDDKDKWTVTKNIARNVAILMAILNSAFLVLSPLAVHMLYGKAFMPCVPSLKILTIAVVFSSVSIILSNYLAAIRYPWFAVYIWIAGAILNVLLNLFMIKKYGIIGAALASLICYAAILFMQYFYISKIVNHERFFGLAFIRKLCQKTAVLATAYCREKNRDVSRQDNHDQIQ